MLQQADYLIHGETALYTITTVTMCLMGKLQISWAAACPGPLATKSYYKDSQTESFQGSNGIVAHLETLGRYTVTLCCEDELKTSLSKHLFARS